MKTQTRILDNRLYNTRNIELPRKGKKSRTVRITLIVICFISVYVTQKAQGLEVLGERKEAVILVLYILRRAS